MRQLPLTEPVEKALHIARALAREYHNEQLTAAHLLRALLHDDVGGSALLKALGQDVAYIFDWADVWIEEQPRSAQVITEPLQDESVDRVLNEADFFRIKLGLDYVELICVLTALTKPGVGFTAEQLRSLPLQERDLLDRFLRDLSAPRATEKTSPGSNGQPAFPGMKAKGQFSYCIDKTAQARAHKLDPVVGRKQEVRTMLEILGRRSKPNVMVVGDPGVGKSALLDGLAQLIVDGQVPARMKNAILLELDSGALLAGASYKGEVEDRLKSVLKEVRQQEMCILFIDEIHTLLDPKGSAGNGIANLLKPELARGELTVVGATTLEEYRKLIEPDQALSRRFELLTVTEPTEQVAERMIRGLIPVYEQHHKLEIQPDVIAACIRLARRYSKERRLPDSALDLLDRTMAAIRIAIETSDTELSRLEKAVQELSQSDLPPGEALEEYRWIDTQLHHQISPVLLGNWEDKINPLELETPFAYHDYIMAKLMRFRELAGQQVPVVTANDLVAVVAHKTGIPMGKVQGQEKERLLSMESFLQRRVVGQNHALRALSDAILESRSGLQRAGQPIGSFFLLGPTGTGKTELSKSLADFLFNDERALIRFDMSEFKEEHSAALLYGAPPGYVGYEEGGLLVNKIRKQPYSVVLFDEIEKAHGSVFDVFLQIMDEGRLHDKLGKEGDFTNALLIFTSNISSEWITNEFQAGRMPTSQQLMTRMTGQFRPEFLARITEIIPFSPIQEENVVRIFEIQLAHLQKSLVQQGVTLTLTKEANRQLALQGFSPQYGARPLAGIIRNQLRRPISRLLISGQLQKGQALNLDWNAQTSELIWQIG
ncbi:ATP-dependent Clp protease ATP-binding subunit [Spirosoma fluviale]|uniref:ATP-dependent Clp protease ATP-binding subunit ClpA n=1 Tax=Spirosoma fluviale TaxID=1597977 RepID=A0A286G3M2_9BACT|nr:ATP-dependent Clp protease ATP-binding subunit [Spirosoma fluviale]SOD90093.1 ATP-dependent Clp protease ATP-binding subunit ClpA [Spirosoma fluviale]